MLFTICYISTAAELLLEEDVHALFSQTIKSNTHNDITGILIYQEGTFIQVLEGDDIFLNSLFKKIEEDPRHKQITKVLGEPIESRVFDEYLLGFSGMHKVGELQAIYLFLKKNRNSPYSKRLYAFLKPFLERQF